MSSSIVEINRDQFCWLNDLVVYFWNFAVAEQWLCGILYPSIIGLEQYGITDLNLNFVYKSLNISR